MREKTSRRKAGCLASLVAENWSSLPRPGTRVRAGDYVLTPMIPVQGSGAVCHRVAPLHCGEPRPLQRLHIACSACGVRMAPPGTSKLRACGPCLKACEINKESYTLSLKGFESRGNACIAWRLKRSGLRHREALPSSNAAEKRGPASTPDKGFEPSSNACIACIAWRPQETQWHNALEPIVAENLILVSNRGCAVLRPVSCQA